MEPPIRKNGTVVLQRASTNDAQLISNLLQLYIHDLSAAFPNVQLGEDGRFAHADLPSYFGSTGGRLAFIIRHEGSVAGFALVKRGSPFSDDPNVLDVAEFFVLRRFRGSGVGRTAAKQLWQQLPGNWTVRAALKNPDAVSFWRRVIAKYTAGTAV